MKKITAIALALVMILSLFAACAEKTGTGTTTEPSAGTTTEPSSGTTDKDKDTTDTQSSSGQTGTSTTDPGTTTGTTTPGTTTDPGTTAGTTTPSTGSAETKTFKGVLDVTEDYSMAIKVPGAAADDRVSIRSEAGKVQIATYNAAGTARNTKDAVTIDFSALGVDGYPWEYLGATVELEITGDTVKVTNKPEKCTFIVPAEYVTFPSNDKAQLPNGEIFDINTISSGVLRGGHLINEGGKVIPGWMDKAGAATGSHTLAALSKADFWRDSKGGYILFAKVPFYDQSICLSIMNKSDLPAGYADPTGPVPTAGTTPSTGTITPITPTTTIEGGTKELPASVVTSQPAGVDAIYAQATFNVRSYNIGFWGDSLLYADTANFFGALCKEAGKPITTLGGGSTYNTTYESSTYSLYECFNWDGKTATSKITGYANSKLKNLLDPESPPVDYYIAMTSRDRALMTADNEGRSLTAYVKVYEMLKANNPDGKYVLLVPPGYQDGCTFFTEKLKLDPMTRTEHSKLIKDFAAKVKAQCPDAIVIQAGDAFDFYYNNFSSYGLELYRDNLRSLNEAGAYYLAALIYASIFERSPFGMEFTGYLTEEEAKTLQKAAHEFVFGKAPTADTSYKAVDPIQFVLKTDERFANQTFPKNYEALYATALAYFERGIFVQYDQLALDRVNFSFNRRSVSLSSPEYGTAQTPLYLDCTAFVWSILKTAFDYELSANRSKPLTYNDLTETIVYEEHITNSTDTDAAIATFLASLQPGDVIAYSNPSNDRGHGVLYLGNGYIIQCSSASHLDTGNADYQYKQKHDSHEGNGGVRIDKIDFMTDPLKLSYQFNPSNDMTIRIIRPDYSKMTPTEDTVNRVNNLMHIVASKETSAPAGVSVNPGDDVTFTIVIKNVGAESKTVSVTDTLPAGVTLKSGSNDFSVTVAPGETVKTSYTVTVAASVAKGTHIDYEGTKAGGVSLGNTPIYVASTLSAADQAKLADAAKAVKSASDAFDIAAAAYKAIGMTLPFSKTEDAADALILKDKQGETDITRLNADSAQFKLIADGLFGGKALFDTDNTYRLKYINYFNLVAGDVVVCRTTEDTVYSYVYLGGTEFMTVRDGEVVTISGTAPCREILERLIGELGFVILRPSLGK